MKFKRILSSSSVRQCAIITLALSQSLTAIPATATETQSAVASGSTTLERSDISLNGARRLINAAIASATRIGSRISIAVVDSGGELVAFDKMDDAANVSINVAIGKARTAALLQEPSSKFEEFTNGGKPSFGTIPGIYPLAGGLPVLVGGRIVGAIGVSGSRGGQDEAIANEALHTLNAQ